jgi:hypothetical protein
MKKGTTVYTVPLPLPGTGAELPWDDGQLLSTRPTNTSYPPRLRTLAVGYDDESQTLFVRFRGRRTGPEQYYDGSPQESQRFRDNWSPGRYINHILNGKPYTPPPGETHAHDYHHALRALLAAPLHDLLPGELNALPPR